MRRIVQRKRFRDDLRRQSRRGKDLAEFFDAVELLAEHGALPTAYQAHRLTGEWSGT
jgi:mRNA-degrading endonuclease YafQ of YafQ-DinJ toxin-antitoxin module